jgi:hypothetical protein
MLSGQIRSGDDVANQPVDEKNLVGSGNCMIVVLLEEITCYMDFTKKLMGG